MAIDFTKIKFFVEGNGDQVFLRDILSIKFGSIFSKKRLEELIIIADGYSGIKNQIDEFKQIEKDKKREGGINIVIFDADYKNEKEATHGFKEKIAFLEGIKKEFDITFEYFLFPDNANDGTLETLLEHCIHPDNIEVLDCWRGFEQCIESKNKGYTIPANKTKIYAYLECLYGDTKDEKKKVKDPNRDFTEKDKWVFDEIKDGSFKEMFDFLNLHLSKFESE